MNISLGKNRRASNPTLLAKARYHFASEFRPYRRLLTLGFICLIMVVLLQLLKPWPLKFIFDTLLIPVDDALLLKWFPDLSGHTGLLLGVISLSILIIAVLVSLFGYGHTYIFKSVGQRIVSAMRRRFYRHIQTLSHSFHDHNHSGDLLVRLTADIRTLSELFVSSVVSMSERGLFLVGMLIVMFWLDWRLALVAVMVLPPLIIFGHAFAVRIRKANRRQRGEEGKLANTINEGIGAIKVVQAYSRETYEEERYAQYEQQNLEAALRAAHLEAQLTRIVEIILGIGACAVLWFGVTRVQSGAISAGDLLIFVAYLKSMHKPIQKMSDLTGKLAKVSACAERIIKILDIQPEVRERGNAITASSLRGEIRFKDVTFGYPNGKTVLENIGFHIHTGEHVAVVGPSGSGKSTLANLILRFYDPTSGSVHVDGRDVRDYTLGSLRDHIAVVLQEAVLFDATLRENILYGRLDADDDSIKRAIDIANARDIINQLENGLDTLVGERGKTLSGGQRQRIAISRAIVRNSPILLLDEPLSGLDAFSCSLVRDALRRLSAGRSTLHITHDIESAKMADRVLYLEHGQIIDIARHDELIRDYSSYRKLWRHTPSEQGTAGSPHDEVA